VGAHEDSLLLEYLLNGLVKRCLQVSGFAPQKQRLRWAVEAAEGLAYLHSKNVFYCDFSVGNLLVDNSGAIKLCEF
jgi:serine/threonine protein kinase